MLGLGSVEASRGGLHNYIVGTENLLPRDGHCDFCFQFFVVAEVKLCACHPIVGWHLVEVIALFGPR
jgi:hypothetical protein